jgi:hypothetical protein
MVEIVLSVFLVCILGGIAVSVIRVAWKGF